MNRTPIDVVDKASDILRALRRGVLVTSKANGRANSMVVEWGTLGFNWGKPVFVCYVRESRYTRELLDANAEFTVNLPVGPFDRRIIAVCGSRSGRDMDKAAELGLTLVDGEKVSVPAVAQLPPHPRMPRHLPAEGEQRAPAARNPRPLLPVHRTLA